MQIFFFWGHFQVILGPIWGPWGQLKKSGNLHKYNSHEAKFMWAEFYGWNPLALI